MQHPAYWPRCLYVLATTYHRSGHKTAAKSAADELLNAWLDPSPKLLEQVEGSRAASLFQRIQETPELDEPSADAAAATRDDDGGSVAPSTVQGKDGTLAPQDLVKSGGKLVMQCPKGSGMVGALCSLVASKAVQLFNDNCAPTLVQGLAGAGFASAAASAAEAGLWDESAAQSQLASENICPKQFPAGTSAPGGSTGPGSGGGIGPGSGGSTGSSPGGSSGSGNP